MTHYRFIAAALCLCQFSPAAAANEETKIVGSSTVTKFAQVSKRRMTQHGETILIEPTGTSGGFSLFCTSTDAYFAPVAMASRPITDKEKTLCAQNGAGEIREYNLGLSGVVLAKNRKGRALKLRREDIFLALAHITPASADDCTLVANPRKTWSDVRAGLPNWPIEVYGPPSTSGTRASFIDLALLEGAKQNECMKAVLKADKKKFETIASTLRVDGAWVDAGENDSVIVAAIHRIPHTLGIMGYPQYVMNEDRIAAAAIDEVELAPDTIASGRYPLSRMLRVYAKEDALGANPAARAFIDEITSLKATGQGGYLSDEGLIPLGGAQ